MRHDLRFPTTATMLELVDAVTIAVPTVLHREVAGPFLARGIATLVEKPMAASAAESEQLVEDARAGGAVLQVGHIERFNPALCVLSSRCRSGPSSSTPSGFRPTRSARPTSASCST